MTKRGRGNHGIALGELNPEEVSSPSEELSPSPETTKPEPFGSGFVFAVKASNLNGAVWRKIHQTDRNKLEDVFTHQSLSARVLRALNSLDSFFHDFL